MEKALGSLSSKSETAAAIRYALSHWRALTRYVDDGLLEIDNSAAERSLRAVVMGRKNYLFMGSDSGGQRAAALYSLIGTAKLNALDPALYLRTVLAQIPEYPINRIEQLLPWNLASSLQNDPSKAALSHNRCPLKISGHFHHTLHDFSRGELWTLTFQPA